ncbi:MAG: trypsin-like peptidase domain-containing protein [Acidimicrobiales bacterium]
MTTLIEELQHAVGHVAGLVGPSVVRIGRGPGRGAGVVIGPNQVLTNAHNLRGPETTVTFADGRTATATLTGSDGDGDLAVLAVDTAAAPAVTWNPTGIDPTPGTPVFAVVNRAGAGVRVTFGLISAVGEAFRGPRGRTIGGGLEHTAPLGRGSSGGPIVDAAGSLVGLNTNRVGDGFYLALPADAELRARVDALAAGTSPSRPRLGVALAPAHAARRLRAAVGLPERDGLLVRSVQDASPAARAGLRQGDLIVEAAGQPVTTTDQLYDALDTAAPTLTIKIVRGTDELDVEVSFDA